MDRPARARQGPYHSGEREVQRRAGLREEAERIGRMVSPYLTDPVARLMADHRMAVAATLDRDARVWASVLTGPAGFLRPVDERLMLIEQHPRTTDPLSRNLASPGPLGLLAIDLSTRRRLRFNGRALHDPVRGIFLSVEQVYGNCPKYIQARRLEFEAGDDGAMSPERASALSEAQAAWIGAADTFFVASFHPEGGADASHRGGAPGFVLPVDRRTVAFGDYPGNTMFNTLGNIAAQPRAGLLFLDFASGDILQLTGRARLDWNPEAVAAFRGAQGVRVVFEIDEVIQTRGAGLRGQLLGYSPFNP